MVSRHTTTKRLTLSDGASTSVHVVRYDRSGLRPRIVLFDMPTRLLDWCEENNIANAINGGFFGNEINGADNGSPVGEVWINGVQKAPAVSKYNRGCLYVSCQGDVQIGLRSLLPKNIGGDLLEAGPLLISNGNIVLKSDTEGFSAEAEFFDNDVTVGRAQRVAIATNSDSVWLVVSEGRSESEAGLTLGEMADFLMSLGATDALNLDGGSGSSLVINQKLINKPRMGEDRDYREFPRGREIVTAIALDNL